MVSYAIGAAPFDRTQRHLSARKTGALGAAIEWSIQPRLAALAAVVSRAKSNRQDIMWANAANRCTGKRGHAPRVRYSATQAMRRRLCLAAALLYAGTAHPANVPRQPVCAGAVNVPDQQTLASNAPVYSLYVAPTGSDTNEGSASAPFKTIGRAAALAKPSTIVHVAPGLYLENLHTKVHGEARARIRFVSDTKWGAKVIGSGTDAMWTNTANYTDIVDFDIRGSGRLGILNYASYAHVSGNHVHDLRVSGGCTGGGGAGIDNANHAGSDNDIVGNVVHDIGVPGQCNGIQGIYSSNLRGHIYNNIIYRVSAWGIHLWHAANRVMIANNTVFANGAGVMGGGIMIGTGDAPGGIVLHHTWVINNLIYDNPAASIEEYCYIGRACIGTDNTIANNLVFGNGHGIALLVGSASGTIVADPQFVNFRADGKGDYRLRRGSPARKRGLSACAPATDIDHVARPPDTAPDIGAYQNL